MIRPEPLPDNLIPYKENYYVDADEGKIYKLVRQRHRKELNVRLNNDCPCVEMMIEGKKKHYNPAKVIYEAKTGETLKQGVIFDFKDGNKRNYAFDNIIIVKRKDYFKGYEFPNHIVLTREEVEAIQKLYDRDTRKKMGNRGKNLKPSYKDLAKMFHCSKSTIYKALNGTYFKTEEV